MTYTVYIKYYYTAKRKMMDCLLDVTFWTNATVPEIKQKAIAKMKRLNGTLIDIREVKVL